MPLGIIWRMSAAFEREPLLCQSQISGQNQQGGFSEPKRHTRVPALTPTRTAVLTQPDRHCCRDHRTSIKLHPPADAALGGRRGPYFLVLALRSKSPTSVRSQATGCVAIPTLDIRRKESLAGTSPHPPEHKACGLSSKMQSQVP